MARPLILRPHILSSLARQSLPRFLHTQKPLHPSSPKPYVTSLNRKRTSATSVRAVSLARRFSVNRIVTRAAANVSDAGSVDSPLMQSMQTKIKEELNAESVSVKDAYGDGRHVSIDVVSAAFEGQSAVNRQRMVYKAIWEELQNVVHAVDQMTTLTPEEAEAKE